MKDETAPSSSSKDQAPSTPSSSSSSSSSWSSAPSLMSEEDFSVPGAFAKPVKAARASIFVKWLVETLGQRWLRDGGVIDIAGGKVSKQA